MQKDNEDNTYEPAFESNVGYQNFEKCSRHWNGYSLIINLVPMQQLNFRPVSWKGVFFELRIVSVSQKALSRNSSYWSVTILY